MKESFFTTAATLLVFLCSRTEAVPSKTVPIGNADIDPIPSPKNGTAIAARPGGIPALVPITITSFFPPDKAALDSNYQAQLTLSFEMVAGSGIRRVKFFVEMVGLGENKFVVRGDADAYSLALTNLPEGTYSWRFEVVTDNTDSDLRKQKFGPWTFTVAGVPTGSMDPSQPTATATPGAAPGGTATPTPIVPGLQSDCFSIDSVNYNICLDLKSVSGNYEPWMDDFGTAKRRWESILRDDGQSAVNLDLYWRGSRDWIATSLPPLVDDLYISGFLEPYDGAGSVLGMAAPYLMRTDAQGFKRPISGYMLFDSADEAWLREQGIWTNTIIHEMGHVLGLGTMWRQNGLHTGSVNDDVYRANSNAQAAWEQLCPGGRLPIETLDRERGIGGGTAGGHWDEDCLVDELMTGFVNNVMPLSNITIASLADMGYTVDYSKADPFGRENLGQCGDYCPGLQRRLRAATGSPGGRRFRNKVSANGHKKILQAAARHMLKIRSTKPASLPSNFEYFAGELLTVFILDEDGDVKDETVSWEEAKEYAPDDISL